MIDVSRALHFDLTIERPSGVQYKISKPAEVCNEKEEEHGDDEVFSTLHFGIDE